MYNLFKFLLIIILILVAYTLSASEYKILLNWDEFEGECNGFLTCSVNNNIAFLNGVGSVSKLDGKVISVGEGKSTEAQQVFKINADDGFFTFWLKDKFADDEMNNDPTLIAQSRPIISIYQDEELVELIKIPNGYGLACKVFTLDTSDGTIDREIRYFPKSRIIIGKVVDAVSGEPLENVKINIVDYMQETINIETDESGIFLFNAEIAEYNIDVSKQDYINADFKIRMGADEMPRELICALSPEIREFRIVLTWGSRPKDLDAHLSGPKPDGGDFHIWYRNQYPIGGEDFLDIDDTDKYGPETVTIYKPAIGNYFYSVYDYSNRAKKRSKKLSMSNATIHVYGENKLLHSFAIPHNQNGNCWHVFEIDEDHKINPINKIDFVENEKNIQ